MSAGCPLMSDFLKWMGSTEGALLLALGTPFGPRTASSASSAPGRVTTFAAPLRSRTRAAGIAAAHETSPAADLPFATLPPGRPLTTIGAGTIFPTSSAPIRRASNATTRRGPHTSRSSREPLCHALHLSRLPDQVPSLLLEVVGKFEQSFDFSGISTAITCLPPTPASLPPRCTLPGDSTP